MSDGAVSDGAEEPVARAATWYVAAFGGLAAALLAGTQWASVDWDRAREPVVAVVSMVVAVGAASTVVFLATRVISPSVTITSLQRREDWARRQARNKVANPPWNVIADKDWLLRQLTVLDFLDNTPTTLAQMVRGGDSDARDRVRQVLVEANRRRANRSFKQLRVATLVAVAIVLTAAMMWSTSIRPAKVDPTPRKPVAVSVTLSNDVDPASAVGPGCTARQLDGVAIGGSLTGTVLVALPAQQDCPAKVVTVDPSLGAVARTP